MPPHAEIGIAKRSYRDAPSCGDDGAVWQQDGRMVACLVDGLGHGPRAQEAARAALAYVADHLPVPLPELFKGCSAAIRDTRGVSMSVVVIDEASGRQSYAAIGSNRALVISGSSALHLPNNHGVVGGAYQRLIVHAQPLGADTLLVLSSDGVREPISLDRYGTAERREMPQLAARLLRDWATGRDDAIVMVLRYRRTDD